MVCGRPAQRQSYWEPPQAKQLDQGGLFLIMRASEVT